MNKKISLLTLSVSLMVTGSFALNAHAKRLDVATAYSMRNIFGASAERIAGQISQFRGQTLKVNSKEI